LDSVTGYASIPGGLGGWAGTLGGSGLAVSAHSLHPQEAIELVRFLVRAQIQSSKRETGPATQPADMPSLQNPHGHPNQSTIAHRPSAVTGRAYEQVARAYIAAVHSVLTGQRPADQAAAGLERQLSQITGLRTGPPQSTN
jgi:trehalose/maltose transport system substrate-binding protein